MDVSDKIISQKILAIKPAYNHKNGTGIAIFDEETNTLEACGLLFASDQMKLADQARQFWNNRVGHKYEPKTLCIEYPQQSLARTNILMGIFCAHVENQFSPETPMRPRLGKWQASNNASETFAAQSQSAITKELALLPTALHHNMHYANVLALWAAEKINGHHN